MNIVRVDMNTEKITLEEIEPSFTGMGGRGLTSFFISKEVPPNCDPLGTENKLVFAPGFFSGSSLVNTSRFSIGAKSPLTGGIKESNVGGTIAADLACTGVSAVIVEGQAAKGQHFILKIDKQGNAALEDATHLWGKKTYDLVAAIKQAHGDHISISCIGPAGEMQLSSASIQSTDRDGRPCRAAGRGGLGAVMGSKGLKALVVEKKAANMTPMKDPGAFKAGAKIFAKAVMADEFTAETLPDLGSAVLVEPINAAGVPFPPETPDRGSLKMQTKSAAKQWPR